MSGLGCVQAALFVAVPSRDEYPDYYEMIKRPIDLTMIRGPCCCFPPPGWWPCRAPPQPPR